MDLLVLASDADLDPLTYAVTGQRRIGGALAVATIDAQGRLRWAPRSWEMGLYDFTVTVSDPVGGVATAAFTVNVIADTVAPSVTVQADKNPAATGDTVQLKGR